VRAGTDNRTGPGPELWTAARPVDTARSPGSRPANVLTSPNDEYLCSLPALADDRTITDRSIRSQIESG
jgi:hypothetical protein